MFIQVSKLKTPFVMYNIINKCSDVNNSPDVLASAKILSRLKMNEGCAG